MAERVIMPKAGMAMEEGLISRWFKNAGDAVAKGEVLLEIETDKVSMEGESDYSGVLLKIVHGEGESVPVIRTIAWIGAEGEEVPEEDEEVPAAESEAAGKSGSAPAPAHQAAALVADGSGRVASTPSAKRAAAERGIDLAGVPPSGRHGEVRLRDVAGFKPLRVTPLARRIAAERGIDLAKISGSGLNGRIRSGDLNAASPLADRREPLKGMRRVIADRMTRSHAEVPSATLYTRADVTALADLRARLNASSALRLSFNDFIMRAVSLVLHEFPVCNASIEGREIVYKRAVNLGVAVALKGGLIVPVVRNADTLSVEEISAQTAALVARAREGLLTPDECSGGSFTVTNLGMYGITAFTPIINLPEVAILGVGAIADELKLDEGRVVVRRVMTLCLTHDHRVIDGADGAMFLKRVRELLEQPRMLHAAEQDEEHEKV